MDDINKIKIPNFPFYDWDIQKSQGLKIYDLDYFEYVDKETSFYRQKMIDFLNSNGEMNILKEETNRITYLLNSNNTNYIIFYHICEDNYFYFFEDLIPDLQNIRDLETKYSCTKLIMISHQFAQKYIGISDYFKILGFKFEFYKYETVINLKKIDLDTLEEKKLIINGITVKSKEQYFRLKSKKAINKSKREYIINNEEQIMRSFNEGTPAVRSLPQGDF